MTFRTKSSQTKSDSQRQSLNLYLIIDEKEIHPSLGKYKEIHPSLGKYQESENRKTRDQEFQKITVFGELVSFRSIEHFVCVKISLLLITIPPLYLHLDFLALLVRVFQPNTLILKYKSHSESFVGIQPTLIFGSSSLPPTRGKLSRQRRERNPAPTANQTISRKLNIFIQNSFLNKMEITLKLEIKINLVFKEGSIRPLEFERQFVWYEIVEKESRTERPISYQIISKL